MDPSRRRPGLAAGLAAGVGLLAALAVLSGLAAAHGGALRGATPERLAVPTWLFLLTGGGAVGASFLLASLVTERAFLDAVHDWRTALPAPLAALRWTGRLLGLAALGVLLAGGLYGPAGSMRNAAILVVWVGWWAGLVAATYLVGDAWPALNPFRTLASLLPGRRAGDADGSPARTGGRRSLPADRLSLPAGRLSIPDRLGAWPAAVALLGVVYLEVVSPLADDPGLLTIAVLGYAAVTLPGAALFGEAWFDRVDPVARLFRTYGRMAPVQRTDSGLALRVPGSALTDDPFERPGEVGFVLALLWGTTFDGAIATSAWVTVADAAVGAGVPPRLVYLGGLAGGFLVFLGLFRLAAAAARRTAPTFLTGDALARRFAPSLVPIAAGYHLAHYLTYFLALAPALVAAVASPVATPVNPPTLALPGWVGAIPLALVLAGHLLAVWVAHAIAYETFPGRLQAVRSQVPLTAAMVGYTTVSLWIVSRPSVTPPYV